MKRQQGMSIVLALFVLVAVALLAAFAVTLGGSERQAGNLDVLNNRALAAARTGLEWGAYRARAVGACLSAPQNVPLTEGALRGYQVTVSCQVYPHTEAVGYNSYDVTATAQYGVFGSADFASRTVSARYFSPGY